MVLEASEGLRGSGRDQGDLEDLGIPVGIELGGSWRICDNISGYRKV